MPILWRVIYEGSPNKCRKIDKGGVAAEAPDGLSSDVPKSAGEDIVSSPRSAPFLLVPELTGPLRVAIQLPLSRIPTQKTLPAYELRPVLRI